MRLTGTCCRCGHCLVTCHNTSRGQCVEHSYAWFAYRAALGCPLSCSLRTAPVAAKLRSSGAVHTPTGASSAHCPQGEGSTVAFLSEPGYGLEPTSISRQELLQQVVVAAVALRTVMQGSTMQGAEGSRDAVRYQPLHLRLLLAIT